MVQNVVIDKTTLRVKRYGYVDFAAKPEFDPETERVIKRDFDFGYDKAWVYNAESDTFEETTPLARFRYCSSSKVVENTKAVIEQTWQSLGGTVTTVGAFIVDASKAWGRVIGQVKAVGDGAQLRLIRESDGLELTVAPIEISDTEGAWVNFKFWANQNQTAETDCFLLQGQLNGAVSMEVRYTSMSLLEKLA